MSITSWMNVHFLYSPNFCLCSSFRKYPNVFATSDALTNPHLPPPELKASREPREELFSWPGKEIENKRPFIALCFFSPLFFAIWEWITTCSQVSLCSSVQFSHSVVSDSLRPHESQHTRLPCLSRTPGIYSNSCLSTWWCHQAISSSVVPFSSCPQSLPASGSFPMSQLFLFSPN